MQARRLWEDTALEKRSVSCSRLDSSVSSPGIVAVVIDDALQRLQCLRLRGSETRVPHWAGVDLLQDWPDHGAVETQQVVPPAILATRYFREFAEVAKFAK